MTLERHYSTREVAELVGVNPEHIRNAVRAGRLSVLVVSPRDWRFTEAEVRTWIESIRVPARVVPIGRPRHARASTTGRPR